MSINERIKSLREEKGLNGLKTSQALGINGAPPGTRTLDPLIKSQLLYQLS